MNSRGNLKTVRQIGIVWLFFSTFNAMSPTRKVITAAYIVGDSVNYYFIVAGKGIRMTITLTVFNNCLLRFFYRGVCCAVNIRNIERLFEYSQHK